jgi:hypothetical protein
MVNNVGTIKALRKAREELVQTVWGTQQEANRRRIQFFQLFRLNLVKLAFYFKLLLIHWSDIPGMLPMYTSFMVNPRILCWALAKIFTGKELKTKENWIKNCLWHKQEVCCFPHIRETVGLHIRVWRLQTILPGS